MKPVERLLWSLLGLFYLNPFPSPDAVIFILLYLPFFCILHHFDALIMSFTNLLLILILFPSFYYLILSKWGRITSLRIQVGKEKVKGSRLQVEVMMVLQKAKERLERVMGLEPALTLKVSSSSSSSSGYYFEDLSPFIGNSWNLLFLSFFIFNFSLARHILCEKQGKINEAYKKLQDGWLSNGDKVPPAEFAKVLSFFLSFF